MRQKIIIDKETITLIITNPEKDDSEVYRCLANGVPTECNLTVEEPPIKFEWLEELTEETDITRTKEGTLSVKLNSGRANVVWLHKGQEVTVSWNDWPFSNNCTAKRPALHCGE